MESDLESFTRIVGPIEDQMIRSVWRITRNRDDAQDAFQVALLRIWSKWREIRKHPNPQAYVLRVCITCAYDQLRQRRTGRFQRIETVAATLGDPEPSASERMAANERAAAVIAAIGTLPRMQRLAVHMHFIEELSYSEIARVFRCDQSTIRKHIQRARRKLRVLLLQPALESEN